MQYKKIKLVREQLSEKLKKYRVLLTEPAPMQGWVKSVRQSLGMNTRHLAERLGVQKQRICEIEKNEVAGNLTVDTLHKVADAMGCVFVYALVPKTSLEEIVVAQAESVVKERMKRVDHTMFLENQQLADEDKKKAVRAAVEEILIESPSSIWEI